MNLRGIWTCVVSQHFLPVRELCGTEPLDHVAFGHELLSCEPCNRVAFDLGALPYEQLDHVAFGRESFSCDPCVRVAFDLEALPYEQLDHVAFGRESLSCDPCNRVAFDLEAVRGLCGSVVAAAALPLAGPSSVRFRDYRFWLFWLRFCECHFVSRFSVVLTITPCDHDTLMRLQLTLAFPIDCCDHETL
jgi:hypothetical protein